jgi:DNA gyrase inhibitor GyrI
LEFCLFKKHWLSILVAFVIPLVAVFGWWGGFSTVSITEAQRGPYRFAYLEHQGELSKLPQTQRKVREALAAQHVASGASITVLFDDPRKVARTELRAQTGYLLDATAQVSEPLKLGTIPARPVLVAEVRAAALLAPSKAYQALHDHLKARQSEIRMPTVEIYDSPAEVYRVGTLSVEMGR